MQLKIKHILLKYDFLSQIFLMELQLQAYQPFIHYRSYLNPQWGRRRDVLDIYTIISSKEGHKYTEWDSNSFSSIWQIWRKAFFKLIAIKTYDVFKEISVR